MIEIKIDTASAKVINIGSIDEPKNEKPPMLSRIIPEVQKAAAPISEEKLALNITVSTHVTEYYEKHK